MLMRFLKGLGIIILLLIITYFLGPRPTSPSYTNDLPNLPESGSDLEVYIEDKEAAHRLKPDNQARIIWFNDSTKSPTPYAVVYIHGFSASQEEGDPVHTDFARSFGCNLYLNRLDDHGLDTTEPLLSVTAEKLWNAAKEAYAVGKKIGKKIILLATSTGATLALKLAAEYSDVHSLIILSPNIAINDPFAWVLNNPWGLQIARMVKGKYNESADTGILHKQYWDTRYRMEAAVQLQELIETTMKESTFSRITQPCLMLYYYKDKEQQDEVVKVSAMKRMFRQLSTPDSLKRQVPIPNAAAHVIGSYIKSGDIQSVEQECMRFAIDILHMQPIKTDSIEAASF